MKNLPNNYAIPGAFATNGSRSADIPADSNPNKMNWSDGFPAVFSRSVGNNGKHVKREDFNAIFYAITTILARIQQGGLIEWSKEVSDAIHGYPEGAKLWYYDSSYGDYRLIKSNVSNNQTQPNSSTIGDGKPWGYVTENMGNMLSKVYPVGSIYIGLTTNCPLAAAIPGSAWHRLQGGYLLASGKLLGGADWEVFGANGPSSPTYIEAGLPNITGLIDTADSVLDGVSWGALRTEGNIVTRTHGQLSPVASRGYEKATLDASRSSGVYGKSQTVRPPAIVVNVWVRTA